MGFGVTKMNELEFKEVLEMKIMKLSESIWEGRINKNNLNEWLGNFLADENPEQCEQTHALFLLSNFMYFGVREIRELLRSVFRDKFYNPLVQDIRKDNKDTKEIREISNLIDFELDRTRFLGMGNPSESGTHLLYYFRQANSLGKGFFINGHEIYSISRGLDNSKHISLKDKSIKRYIFLDDVCGSGTQAKEYSETLLREMKSLDPSLEVFYFSLFATSHGIKEIIDNTLFDKVDCVFELDDTFKCFSSISRYFNPNDDVPVSKEFARNVCHKYGGELRIPEQHRLGYKDGQLLLGFTHNTPDNTLPIIWENSCSWKPIFKRYHK